MNIKNFLTILMFAIALAVNAQEAKPPVMGWASWNNYHVNINEEIIRSQADAMAANGMKEAGYRFLNIDDGFFGGRDKKGRLLHHKQRFPHGMRALSDYIRKKGFVPGIYTDAGINTCGCHYDRDTISTGCGLYGHEREDLKKMMVEWNFDFIKVDWCGGQWAELNEREQYTKIGKIIRELKPQAVYNVCRWQFPGEWVTEIADSWRISGDIRDRFSSIMGIVDQNADLWPYCSPGHYNDMDMLQVGRGMSEEEDRTHFTMWCVMVSPLLAGNDLTQMSQQTLDILTNKELIAVNQDPLFLQARRVIDLGDQEVWAKRLASEEGKSRWAVVLLNRGKNMARMELPLNVTDISANGYAIRDLWLHKDLGANYNKTTTHDVPGHGVKAFILEGDTDGGIVPEGIKDEMTRRYIAPKRLMWRTEADSLCFSATDKLFSPLGAQAEMVGSGYMKMLRPKDYADGDDNHPSLIIDFGQELHGGIEINLAACKGGVAGTQQVRIRFGESVGEVCSELGKRGGEIGKSTNDHIQRDFQATLSVYGTTEYGNTGFRFVRIDFLSPDAEVTLKSVRAILRVRDLEYLGSFRCDDDRLNRIWQVGAWTTHLNMQEHLWDGIKRDRLVWLGDMHPGTATAMTVFGANPIIRQTLDEARRQFPLPRWMNDMSSYSMWYMIILRDYYKRSGDKLTLLRNADYTRSLLGKISSMIDSDGNETLDKWRFLDWPSSPDAVGVEMGYRALLSWSLQAAMENAREVGDTYAQSIAASCMQRLAKQTRQPNGLKQSAALMSLAGQIPAEKAAQIILDGGARGFSTFYGYYMLEALARSGHYAEAEDIISQFWGAMIDRGATSFWEDFDLRMLEGSGRIDEFTPSDKKDIHGAFGDYCYKGYRHSLCHAWASGPTAWLSEHVLGVQPLAPGYKKIKVTPHLGRLQWAEGTVPTPHGVIHVSAKNADGKTITTVRVPAGITVEPFDGLTVEE